MEDECTPTGRRVPGPEESRNGGHSGQVIRACARCSALSHSANRQKSATVASTPTNRSEPSTGAAGGGSIQASSSMPEQYDYVSDTAICPSRLILHHRAATRRSSASQNQGSGTPHAGAYLVDLIGSRRRHGLGGCVAWSFLHRMPGSFGKL